MKSLILLLFFSVVSKLTGLFRELSIGFFYGVGESLDIYILCMLAPSFVLDLFSSTFNSFYIPFYKNKVARIKHLVFISLLFTLFFAFLSSLFIYSLNNIFVASFFIDATLHEKVIIDSYSIPIALYAFMFILNEFFKSLLICNNRTHLIPLLTILGNIVFILVIYLYSYNSWSNGIAVSFCLFISVQSVLSAFLTRRGVSSCYPIKRINLLQLNYFKYIPILIPIMIGSVTNQLNKSVDKYIVSGYETGSLSTVYFAQQFYAVIVGVLVVNIALYYYPKICDSINLERQRLSSLAKEAMFLLTSISLVVTFFTIFYGRHILQLIFQYGQISSSDVDSVYVIMCIYTIGLVFEANSAILKRILWADKKTKAVMFITITTVVLNVILSLFLSRIFSIYGVISATVFTNFMCLVILAFYCKGYITFDSADVKFFIYSITTTMMVFLSIYFAELQYHDSLYIEFFSFLAFIIVSLMLYKQWSKKFVT